MAQGNCLFCRIARREIPADVVAQTEDFFAVNDINPQAPTHVLIIPTEHISTLADATEDQTALLGRALQLANRLAREHRLMPDGYRVVVNCGPQAGQSVFHLHLHLLGGRPMRWPPG